MGYTRPIKPPALERVPWKQVEDEFFDTWGRDEKGEFRAEHISIVGPTGSGKSNFQRYVLSERAKRRGTHAIVIATKPADSTLRKMRWPIIRTYPPKYGQHERFILWPESSKNEYESLANQHQQIRHCLTDIWEENANRVVAFDEIAFVEQELKMKTLINRYWREGRSLGISVVATTQRPRNVTRYMWSEPTWIVAFRPDDEDEGRRVAEIIGGRGRYLDDLMDLKEYEFILIKRRTGVAIKCKLPR